MVMNMPAHSCDCHLHIYDSMTSGRAGAELPPRMPSVTEYRRLQEHLGMQRAVVVTPSLYGTNNRPTLEAIRSLGPNATRGIAVIHPDIDDEALIELKSQGICGIRFSLYNYRRAATTLDMIEPLAHRIKRLGWHIQLHMLPEQIVKQRKLITRLPVPLVFDHLARLGTVSCPLAHAAFSIVAELIARDRAWVKLSAPYLNSEYASFLNTVEIAHAFINIGSTRVVWGSDWPHPTELSYTPDDTSILELLKQWAPNPAQRRRILVENPAELYLL